MRLPAAMLWSIALAGAMPARASAPSLEVYVTDQDQNGYVAIYDGVAVELANCPNAAAARALLALPGDAAIAETTLNSLRTGRGLVQPRIPCAPDAKFDADFPATTKVWFD